MRAAFPPPIGTPGTMETIIRIASIWSVVDAYFFSSLSSLSSSTMSWTMCAGMGCARRR